jgi:hypothetical protein
MQLVYSLIPYALTLLWFVGFLYLIRAFLTGIENLTFHKGVTWMVLWIVYIGLAVGFTKLPAYSPKTQEKAYVPVLSQKEVKDIPFNAVTNGPTWEQNSKTCAN